MVNEGVKYKITTCEAEYAKKKELNKDDIKQLIEWSHKQPHLPNITELQCIRYYSCNDFSLQKTKSFIELHFTFRHEFPDLFNHTDFELSKSDHSIWDAIYIYKCDKPTSRGTMVIYAGLKDTDVKKFDWTMAGSMFHKVTCSTVLHEGICDGYEFVLDMDNLKFEHLRTLTIPFVRKYLTYIQEALEVKMTSLNVIRITPLLDKILILVKPFMKKELWELLHFYSDMNKFFEVIPEEFISIDLNGKLPYTRNELNEISIKKLIDLKDDILADIAMRTDESKRPNGVGKAPCLTASFKKLDLD